MYQWFKKQNEVGKFLKSETDDPLNFDGCTDNVDLLRELTTQLEGFKIQQQKRIDAANTAIELREKKELAANRKKIIR